MKRFLPSALVLVILVGISIFTYLSTAQAQDSKGIRFGLRAPDPLTDTFQSRTSFNRGEIIQVGIIEIPSGTGTRELAIFRSDQPNTPYRRLTIQMNNANCTYTPTNGWSGTGLPIHSGNDHTFCQVPGVLWLKLDSNGLDCSSSGASCTVRLSKLNQNFGSGTAADRTEPGLAGSFNLSYDNPTGPRPISMTVDPSSITGGTDVQVTMNDLTPDADYTLTVEWSGGQTNSAHTLPFKADCFEKPNTSGKVFQANDLDWCKDPVSMTTYTVYLKTAGFNCAPGVAIASTCTIRLVGNGQNITKTLRVTPRGPSLTINTPSPVEKGKPVDVTIADLSPSRTYTLTLRTIDGSKIWHTFTFTTGNGGSCASSGQGDGSFHMGKSGDQDKYCDWDGSKSAYTHYLWLDTTGYNCAAQPLTTAGCSLHLAEGTIAWDDASFTMNLLGFRLEFPPDTVARPEVGGQPVLQHNYYGGKKDIAARGCFDPDKNVVFKIYKTALLCNDEGICRSQSTSDFDAKDADINNEIAKIEYDFKPDGNYKSYLVEATCGDQTVSESVKAFGKDKGSEFLTVSPEIAEDEVWELTVGGLDKEWSDDGFRYYNCYFFQLIQLDPKEYLQPEDFSSLPQDYDDGCRDGEGADGFTNQSLDNDIDDKYDEGEMKFFAASSDWQPESTMKMPGLKAGRYEARLYRVVANQTGVDFDDGDTAIKPRGVVIFCVAVSDPTCSNLGELPPPPFPPCAIALDKDGNEVVVTKDTDTTLLVKCIAVATPFGIDFYIDPPRLVASVMGVLLSISGGIALLLIIFAGYQLVASRGEPDKIAAARELLTSAIVGLLFIIFSIVVLEIIGVDILRIPGFTP